MAQQGQQQSGDNSMAPVWIMAFLILVAVLFWYYGRAHIVSFVFSITLFQAKLVAFFMGSSVLSSEIYMMKTLDPATVEWSQLVELTSRVGSYLRYPFCFILACLSVILYKSDVTLKYKRIHNMKTLRAQEQSNWPCIMPVVNQDLAKQDINSGPWAMALSPMEFARKYNLLKKEDVLLEVQAAGLEMTAGLRRAEAKRYFTLQLGPYWTGFDKCPPQAAALAAIFLARLNRDRKAAAHILRELDKTSLTGKPDYSVAFPTLQKYQACEQAQELAQKHAYLLTFMASLLKLSRDDGVVPSCEFLWLKPVDRRLWYMLNCVGRQTPFAEVGGPFAHWRAEQVLGRASKVPMIDEAIKSLEIAIKEVKLSPKELQGLQP